MPASKLFPMLSRATLGERIAFVADPDGDRVVLTAPNDRAARSERRSGGRGL